MIASLLFIGILLYKDIRSKKLIRRAENKDSFWNYDKMQAHARLFFYNVQEAFERCDHSFLVDHLPASFFESLTKKIKGEPVGNKISNNVDLYETRIVCCRDMLDNNKDCYVAYLNGLLINADGDQKEFSGMYHFTRQDNNWYLNKITGTARVANLIILKNVVEK